MNEISLNNMATKLDSHKGIYIDAYLLSQAIGVLDNGYAQWLKEMGDRGFEQGIDYYFVENKGYFLSLSMAEFCAAFRNNDLGKNMAIRLRKAHKKYIESQIHKSNKNNVVQKLPTTSEALYALADKTKECEELKIANTAQSKMISDALPKLNFVDHFMDSQNNITMDIMADIISQDGIYIDTNTMMETMRDNGFLLKSRSRYNQPSLNADINHWISYVQKTFYQNGKKIVDYEPMVTMVGQRKFKKWFSQNRKKWINRVE